MAPSEDSGRRNPSVLVKHSFFSKALLCFFADGLKKKTKVTDSRNQQHSQRPSSRRSAVPPATRLITVDNVLQYASDVPSMRQRRPPPPPQQRPQMRSPRSRLSSSAGLASSTGMMAGGGGMGGVAGSVPAGRLTAQARLPPRSTKVTEKLVLLPETQTDGAEDIEGEGGEGPAVRMLDEETVQRLARERNIEPETLRRQLLDDLAARRQQQRLVGGDFDEDNELAPLLAEEERLRRRRVPPEKAKSYAERLPKARRAEQLPRVTAYCTAQGYKMGPTAAFVKEWHGARTKLYDDCLYTAYHLPLLPGRNGYRVRSSPVLKSAGGKVVLDEEIERNEQRDYHEEYPGEAHEHSVGGGRGQPATDAVAPPDQQPGPHSQTLGKPGPGRPRISPNVFHIAEMFVFSYGVVVFWNFTEHQEKDILADLTFSSTTPSSPGQPSLAPSVPLATNPLAEEDFETEEFHFEYSTEIPRPRVYNDMITLRSGDHMIKLAISHAIAQSTKLCFFEEAMAKEMADAKDIPRRLATEGKLGMKRDEVFRILGRLFKSRVEVNLCTFPILPRNIVPN